MSKYVPDKLSVSNPDDAAFQTGKPASAGLFLRLNQSVSHLFELVTAGAAPGKSEKTLDGASERFYPHDHSGVISAGGAAYSHGVFLGSTVAFGLGTRLPALPFELDGWTHSDGAVSLEFLSESADACAPCRKISWTTKNADHPALYAASFSIRARRGTNRLSVSLEGFAVKNALATPVRIAACVFDDEWRPIEGCLVSEIAPATSELPALPERTTVDLILPVAPNGEALTKNRDLRVALAAKSDADQTYAKEFYYFGAQIYEMQA